MLHFKLQKLACKFFKNLHARHVSAPVPSLRLNLAEHEAVEEALEETAFKRCFSWSFQQRTANVPSFDSRFSNFFCHNPFLSQICAKIGQTLSKLSLKTSQTPQKVV